MIPFWVHTEDGEIHRMGAISHETAPKAIMFPEEIEAYEEYFSAKVVWVAVDRIDNIVWRKP